VRRFASLRDAAPLLVAALLLFTANLGGTSLPPLDDCFYARKGAEMAQHPGMTVRWGGGPAFQNPPGHFWVLAASFRLFGANDGAARLPTALMAVGALAGVAWIGARLFSPAAGAVAAALLAVSPFFLNQGRRVMLEVPLLFWTVLAMAALVAWQRDRRWVLVFAPALGMALLTKSVLGLAPLGVAFAAGLTLPAWRPLLGDPRFWLAAAAGVAFGASWPIQQWQTYGTGFTEVHFGREIFGRSLAPIDWTARVFGYPALLITHHAPAFPLGLFATFRGWAERRSQPAALLVVWGWLPLVAMLLSSAQSARYVFPLVPAFALLGGGWLAERWPRAAGLFATRLVPAVFVLGALVFWWRPQWLTRDANAGYRTISPVLRTAGRAGVEAVFWGGDYWRVANPLMWYTGVRLTTSAETAKQAITRAETGNGLLMVEPARLDTLPKRVRNAWRWVTTRDAVLLDLHSRP
jgi:4-amino-4-deoxy-L-arabinose transferase-like glycosyltransferase